MLAITWTPEGDHGHTDAFSVCFHSSWYSCFSGAQCQEAKSDAPTPRSSPALPPEASGPLFAAWAQCPGLAHATAPAGSEIEPP